MYISINIANLMTHRYITMAPLNLCVEFSICTPIITDGKETGTYLYRRLYVEIFTYI